MSGNKPQRLRILVYKTEGNFAVADENKNRLVLPINNMRDKMLFFDKFVIVINTMDDHVTLGVSEIETNELGVGHPGNKTVGFIDEVGTYDFSSESKRFIRIPD